MGRIIAIGDVHGCYTELVELLRHVNPGPKDTIIQLGDLVNRGPESGRVVRFMRENNYKSLLGNHEHRLLRYRWSKDPSLLKKYDFETIEVLTEADWRYLESMPLFHYEEYMQTVFVHAGFLPGGNLPWNRQSLEILLHIQVIGRNGQPAKRSLEPEGAPWADFWKGPPFVIYGHTPRPRVYRTSWALGIDTACAYGGHLTACILPGQEIIQVPAAGTYAFSKTLPQPVA